MLFLALITLRKVEVRLHDLFYRTGFFSESKSLSTLTELIHALVKKI